MFSWIPNALTISRCVFAGLVLFGALKATGFDAVLAEAGMADLERQRSAALQQLWYQFTLLAFISGMLTDFLDGWAARTFKAESRFGVWLDPIADKLLVGAALITLSLALKTWLIYIPAALILARDVFMTWLRTRPEAAGVVAPSNLAKWKTAIEMMAITGLLLPMAMWPMPETVSEVGLLHWSRVYAALLVLGLWVAAALSLFTGGQYVMAIKGGGKR
ncbi:CDP-alcohol phosphatidyltransferase family protein [Hyphomonas sp. WL0036]|uniref:CDP-alcohol phosphatidyltransferase family protein n=1 Tax=Hyphomonas sediminis TaxID=2866160 RepID=UPI001C81A49F|nr:CDP-alcohol phosphatidyltransferase family protein [Hyphomonas sediminis]MBY9065569.1 CDP-alcohol phosphatidyltransferase family protein [Hyphomonas sediminis]